MNGHGPYVWTSYALALIVLGGLCVWTIASYRQAIKRHKALQASDGGR